MESQFLIDYLLSFKDKKSFKHDILTFYKSDILFIDEYIKITEENLNSLNVQVHLIDLCVFPEYIEIFNLFKVPCYIYMYEGKERYRCNDIFQIKSFTNKVIKHMKPVKRVESTEEAGNVEASTPVAEAPQAPPRAKTQTKADVLWGKIKDLKVNMFALPNQKVSNYCKPVPGSVDTLLLTYHPSAFVSALEETLQGAFDGKVTSELQDKYLCVSEKNK